MVAISARNTKVYKICKLCKAIFSAFYNISQSNFAILLILVYALSSYGDLFAYPCLVFKLVYNVCKTLRFEGKQNKRPVF
jgi:hypothetical protein